MKEHLFRTFNLVSALSILWMEMSARYKYLHYYYYLLRSRLDIEKNRICKRDINIKEWKDIYVKK